jgi:2-dehydropantoate 2-reductase
VRRPEQASALASGIRLEDPSSGEVVEADGRAVVGFDRAAALGAGTFFVCTRASDTSGIAAPLANAAASAAVVSVQNHVDNEAVLAQSCAHVYGAVWRQTCMRVGDNLVRALGRARVVVGAYPAGANARGAWLAQVLRSAGFDVGVSAQIMQDKWLKLCINLMSAPNALVRPDDHTTTSFVEGKVRLLEEARAVLTAAHIEARSCDGRDRSLDEEIIFQHESLARGKSARKLPVYNQVWREFDTAKRTSDAFQPAPEADAYHRLVCELARRHGLGSALNARVLDAVDQAWAARLGPECYTARQLFGA